MPLKESSRHDCSKHLLAAAGSIDSAWQRAARDLDDILKKLGASRLAIDSAIVTRIPGGVVSHVPVRVQRPIKFGDFHRRPHAVAALLTTFPLVDRLTERTVEPGSYVVRLRPAGHEKFALDLFEPNGERSLSTLAEQKPSPPSPRFSFRFLGIDVDIDPPDDILNPFKHLICLSFLHWRTCFEVPTKIWPL